MFLFWYKYFSWSRDPSVKGCHRYFQCFCYFFGRNPFQQFFCSLYLTGIHFRLSTTQFTQSSGSFQSCSGSFDNERCSISARLAIIWKKNFPAGVDVSIPSVILWRWIPLFSNSPARRTSCFKLLPSRSSFQTISMSLFLSTSKAKSSPGRPCLLQR